MAIVFSQHQFPFRRRQPRDRLADLLDNEWKGPLPHTLLVAPGGKVIYRHNGPIDSLELRRAIVDYLGRTYASKSK